MNPPLGESEWMGGRGAYNPPKTIPINKGKKCLVKTVVTPVGCTVAVAVRSDCLPGRPHTVVEQQGWPDQVLVPSEPEHNLPSTECRTCWCWKTTEHGVCIPHVGQVVVCVAMPPLLEFPLLSWQCFRSWHTLPVALGGTLLSCPETAIAAARSAVLTAFAAAQAAAQAAASEAAVLAALVAALAAAWAAALAAE